MILFKKLLNLLHTVLHTHLNDDHSCIFDIFTLELKVLFKFNREEIFGDLAFMILSSRYGVRFYLS